MAVKIVGLLGGVASGKSWVARQLQARGARLFDADRVGHEVLLEPEIKTALRNRWGAAVFSKGEVSRPAIAKLVFAPEPAGTPELTFLENLVHPRITARLRDETAALASAQGSHVLVLDAPILLKAGWDRLCDRILFVDAPRDVRLARALHRGWTAAEFAAREAVQEPLAEKRDRADEVLDNSKTLKNMESSEPLERQLSQMWGILTAE
ncbi:MAG TPA: dephospho-CoA kinase [Pirellulales bacterium]|jgi:dephospho-CoA kinase|nr:dephospho-CoA kinase [Pirellulales bacterium]